MKLNKALHSGHIDYIIIQYNLILIRYLHMFFIYLFIALG